MEKQEWAAEYKKIKVCLTNMGQKHQPNNLEKNKQQFLKMFPLNKTSQLKVEINALIKNQDTNDFAIEREKEDIYKSLSSFFQLIDQFKSKVKNYRQDNNYLQDLKNQSEFINNNMSQFQAKAMRDYEGLQNNYDKIDNDLELFDQKIDTYEQSVDTSRPQNNPV